MLALRVNVSTAMALPVPPVQARPVRSQPVQLVFGDAVGAGTRSLKVRVFGSVPSLSSSRLKLLSPCRSW